MVGTKQEPNGGSTQRDPDRFWVILGIVVIVIFVISLACQSFFATARFNTLPANINRDVAYQKYKEGVFILDVRDHEEWVVYHIPGVTLIPLDELESRTSEISFDQEVLVICSLSIRSRTGRNTLLAAGHTRVSSITGGLVRWEAAGYPVVTGE